MDESKPMGCPRCGADLVDGGKQRYVDLSEHVGCRENDPNWKPEPRDTWVCKRCELPGFYDDYGSYYSGVVGVPNKYYNPLNSHELKAFRNIHKDRPEDIEMVDKLPDNVDGPWDVENKVWELHDKIVELKVKLDMNKHAQKILEEGMVKKRERIVSIDKEIVKLQGEL